MTPWLNVRAGVAHAAEFTLNAHLNKIDETAHARMELMTKQMAAAQGITEELKTRDQMAWVGAMNNIRNAAEAIVFSELIYT